MLFDCASSQLILVHFHCAGNLLCQHNTLIDLDDIIDSFQQLFWFESTFSLFQSLWTPYDVQYLVSSFFLAKWSRFSIEIIPGNVCYINCFVRIDHFIRTELIFLPDCFQCLILSSCILHIYFSVHQEWSHSEYLRKYSNSIYLMCILNILKYLFQMLFDPILHSKSNYQKSFVEIFKNQNSGT